MQYNTQYTIPYFISGDNPKLLITTGTHGDEFHVIPKVEQVINELAQELPKFMYIPEISPSAVKAKSRKNGFGNDMNRNFGNLMDPESIALKQILSKLTGTLGISFHQDFEFPKFYVYDTHTMDVDDLEDLRSQVRTLGVPLYSGIDQIEDPMLGNRVVDGYVGGMGAPSEAGLFIEDWAMNYGYISRFFTFEIPHEHPRAKDLIRLCIKFSLRFLKQHG